MITEQGTIKTSAKLDEKVTKELLGPTFKIGIAFLIIGAVGLAVFLIIDIVSVFTESEYDFAIWYGLSAFVLFMGIFLVMLARSAAKNALKYDKVNYYEFFKDYFVVNQSLNGENVITAKIYNFQITRVKDGKNYLFLYVDAGGAYPVLKSELNGFEINTIKSLFNKNGVSAAAALPQVPPQAEVPTQPEIKREEEKDGDPFDDLK